MKTKALVIGLAAAWISSPASANWFANDLTDATGVAGEFNEYHSSHDNSVWSYTNDYALAQDGTLNTVLQGGAVLSFVTADDDTARTYLGTASSNYLDASWTAHIAVETVNVDPKNYIFFGLGDPTPKESYFNEPQEGQSVYVNWRSGQSSAKVRVKRNGAVVHDTGQWQGDPGYDIYLIYDHVAKTVQFQIDNWNGGRFSGINVTTDPVSIDGFLTNTNETRIFFGGNATMTFGDFWVEETFGFTHPGLPHTIADLDAIKAKLNVEPWKTGYDDLAADSKSQLTYTMQGPFASVSRTPHINLGEYRSDMQAIYNLARMWYYTGNSAYAQKSRDILISWATNHTSFDGGEIYLSMGDYTYRVFGGAEILRYTWPGWTQADTDLCQAYFEDLYWDQGSIANGYPLRSANQGVLELIPGIGVAVFNDDEAKFNQCLAMFRSDAAGALLSSLPNGQIGDTGRDFHSYGQLQHLAWIAEVFWKQGVDVFAEHDNRLLAAGEYFARYNLGIDTPFVQAGTVYDVYPEINTLGNSGQAYGGSPDALNILHGAYVVRKGMSAPYLEIYRDILTEESESFDHRKTADASWASVPDPSTPAAAVASVTMLNDTDMGDALPAGNAAYSAGTWTVTGRGSDLWYNSTPDYHFAYLPVTGDATIIAQLTSLTGSETDARAGLVFSEDLSSSAAMAAVILTNPTGDDKMYAFTRGDVSHSHPGNDYRQYPAFPSPKLPYWLKIERIGDRVTLYSSPDGASWSTAHSADYAMGSSAHLGLAVCSHHNGSPATATFTDVRITGGDGGEAPQVPEPPFATYASPAATEVTLRWLESFEATQYHVLRATSIDGAYAPIAEVDGTFFVDTNSAAGMGHYYAVEAVNSVGVSSRSKLDYERTQPIHYQAEDHDAQSGLRFEHCGDFWGGQNTSFGGAGDWCRFDDVVVDAGSILIARVATGNANAAGQIEVRLNGPTGTIIGTVDVPDTGGWQNWETVTTPLSVSRGVYNICLRFTDANATGSSAIFNLNWFNIIKREKPTHLRATPISASQIDLYWEEMPGATTYRLQRSTVSGGPYVEIMNSSDFSYSDTGLSAGTSYYYVVSAVYDTAESLNSPEVVGVPSAPMVFEDVLPQTTGIIDVGTGGLAYFAVFSPSGLGYNYRVMATDTLVSPVWQEVSGVVPGTGGELIIDALVGSEARRYYRTESWRQ